MGARATTRAGAWYSIGGADVEDVWWLTAPVRVARLAPVSASIRLATASATMTLRPVRRIRAALWSRGAVDRSTLRVIAESSVFLVSPHLVKAAPPRRERR